MICVLFISLKTVKHLKRNFWLSLKPQMQISIYAGTFQFKQKKVQFDVVRINSTT